MGTPDAARRFLDSVDDSDAAFARERLLALRAALGVAEDEVAPVGWNGFMSQMLGKVYKIEDVEVEDQSAELAAVPGEKNCWWPYTTLLKVEWD